MSRIHKIMVEEIVEITRQRIVEVESELPLAKIGSIHSLDSGDVVEETILDAVTTLVREQNSHEGDVTIVVTKAKFLS